MLQPHPNTKQNYSENALEPHSLQTTNVRTIMLGVSSRSSPTRGGGVVDAGGGTSSSCCATHETTVANMKPLALLVSAAAVCNSQARQSQSYAVSAVHIMQGLAYNSALQIVQGLAYKSALHCTCFAGVNRCCLGRDTNSSSRKSLLRLKAARRQGRPLYYKRLPCPLVELVSPPKHISAHRTAGDGIRNEESNIQVQFFRTQLIHPAKFNGRQESFRRW